MEDLRAQELPEAPPAWWADGAIECRGLATGLLAFALLALAARRWLPAAPAAASFLQPRQAPF